MIPAMPNMNMNLNQSDDAYQTVGDTTSGGLNFGGQGVPWWAISLTIASIAGLLAVVFWPEKKPAPTRTRKRKKKGGK